MFRKILTVVFCFVLLLGISTMVFAKKAKTSDGEEVSTTVVEKMSEPKNNLKEKIGLAFTTAGAGSLRLWITNSLGLDMSADLSVGGGSDFGLGIGANIVFPIMEEGPAALYVKPGMLISFDTISAGGISTSDIGFNFNVGLEAEAFIVKNLLSIGGSAGLNIGINVHSAPAPIGTTTAFIMNLGTSPAALFARVYL